MQSVILLHALVVRSNSDGLRSPKPRSSWFLGLLEMLTTTILDLGSLIFCRTTQHNSRKSKNELGKCYFGRYKYFKHEHIA